MFKIFCFCFLLLGSSFLHPLQRLSHTQEYFTPCEQWAVDIIYDGLEVIDELCRANNIEYALTGGTLLGSHWYGGLIPWDDDGDISMLEDDVARFLALAPQLKKRGFDIVESEWGYYISPHNGIPTRKGQNYPAIDLFPLKLRDGRYTCASDRAYNHWPNEYFTQKEWSRIANVPFGYLWLRGHRGKDAERMLNSSYGPTWKNEARVWWDHKEERYREEIIVRVENPRHIKHSAHK